MGDGRESELVKLQGELAAAAAAGGAKAGRTARRAVRLNPLAWMAVSFLAGAAAGALLRPVGVRRGRDAG